MSNYRHFLASILVLSIVSLIPVGHSFAQTELQAPLSVASSQVLLEKVQELKAQGATSGAFDGINSIEDVDFLNLSERYNLQKEIALADNFSTNIPNPCSEYYNLGSVVTVLEAEPSAIVSGGEKQFTLKITNNNNYPIAGASVPIKVYAVDTQSNQKILGLVDEFVALTDINVQAGATIEHTFTYVTPTSLPTGSYEVVPYVTVADTYHIVGLPFTDDVKGGSAVISVEGERADRISFNRDLVFLNNTQYDFTALSPQFSKDTPIQVTAPIFNGLDVPLDATITWKLYSYDKRTDARLLTTATQTVSVGTGDNVTATHIVKNTEYATYLLRGEVEHLGAKSIVDIRFTRIGATEPRVNFAGLLNYPTTQENDITMFACAQAIGDGDVSGAEISMTVTNETGKVLHTETFSDSISANQTLFSSSFAPRAPHQSLTLTTKLSLNQQLLSSTVVTYECSKLSGGECAGAGESVTDSLFQKLMSPLLALAALPFFIVLFFLIRRRRKQAGAQEIEYTTPTVL